ncbi:MAG: TRAP transporter large permease subunit [Alphaproteobacteria bacterium]
MLVSRGRDVPADLQGRVDVLLEGTDGEAIIDTLRGTEFTERKSALIRGVTRFATSIDAMLGADAAEPYQAVLERAEGAKNLDELTASVRGAPRGQAVQRLVNRADKEFDFAPYELAAEDYASTVSKARRKSVLRKFKDDPEGAAAEMKLRADTLTEKIGAVQALYEPFFDDATNAAFVDNLAIIQSATDLEAQLNAIRELPASGDFDRAVDEVNGFLKRDSYLASSFTYDRAIRAVADGQVPFEVAKPVNSDAANLLRKAFPDLGNGDAPRQLSAYFRDSLSTYRVPPVSMGVAAFLAVASISLLLAAALRRRESLIPLGIGALGVVAFLIAAVSMVTPDTDPWTRTAIYAIPTILILYGMAAAVPRLLEVEVIRVVVPPVVLIVAVLGSIFGGITNPTPAAALGAGGAILLSAIKLLEREEQVGPFDNNIGRNILLWTAGSIAVMLLVKANFLDGEQAVGFGKSIATFFATILYVISILGMIYAAIVLLSARVEGSRVANPRTIRSAVTSYAFSNDRILTSILMETAKVSVMVFAILIGSQLLALTLRSFGGEEYIEHFLRSFEDPRFLLFVVMIVLFILGFVLDFIEIIFIVIPIVGPVVYGADPNIMHPAWITILIAVNLQTSFITPPFGFALFYLRGVAPPEIQTSHIYRGIIPFVIIQVVGLTILWFFPQITTFLPELLPDN